MPASKTLPTRPEMDSQTGATPSSLLEPSSGRAPVLGEGLAYVEALDLGVALRRYQTEAAAQIALEFRKYQEAMAQVEQIELEVKKYQEAVAQFEIETKIRVSPEWASTLSGLRGLGDAACRCLFWATSYRRVRKLKYIRKLRFLIESNLRQRRIPPRSHLRPHNVGYRPWLARRMCYEQDEEDDSVSSERQIEYQKSILKRKTECLQAKRIIVKENVSSSLRSHRLGPRLIATTPTSLKSKRKGFESFAPAKSSHFV